MTRGGVASRSTTLTVSMFPSDPPALPLSAVSAMVPEVSLFGEVRADYGRTTRLASTPIFSTSASMRSPAFR